MGRKTVKVTLTDEVYEALVQYTNEINEGVDNDGGEPTPHVSPSWWAQHIIWNAVSGNPDHLIWPHGGKRRGAGRPKKKDNE